MNANAGEVSDGYHTFNELYDHRSALFICLMKSHINNAWASRSHFDGSKWDGWFICGLHLNGSDITYHFEDKWLKIVDDAGIPILDRAPREWDGHTSADVLNRLVNSAITQ